MLRRTCARSAYAPVAGADRFWSWCTDHGVTSRKLELVRNTDVKLRQSLTLLAGEPIRSRGSVVAAIPYSIGGRIRAQHSLDSQQGGQQHHHHHPHTAAAAAFSTSIVLNAETVPLGLIPPHLPAADDMERRWRSRLAKYKKRGTHPDMEAKFRSLLSTFRARERRFAWLSGLVACAAVQRELAAAEAKVKGVTLAQLLESNSSGHQSGEGGGTTALLHHFDVNSAAREYMLYQHCAPYLDLILPPVGTAFDKLAAAIAAEDAARAAAFDDAGKQTYATLAQLHRWQQNTLLKLMSMNSEDDAADALPPDTLAWCAREVLARAISLPPGCPPEHDDEDEDEDENQELDGGMNFGLRAAPSRENSLNRPRFDERYMNRIYSSGKSASSAGAVDDESLSSVLMLPSLMPIVDFLEQTDDADHSGGGPNVQVVATESPIDGIRRIAVVSLRPIAEGEVLTACLMLQDGDSGEDSGQLATSSAKQAVAAFRFRK